MKTSSRIRACVDSEIINQTPSRAASGRVHSYAFVSPPSNRLHYKLSRCFRLNAPDPRAVAPDKVNVGPLPPPYAVGHDNRPHV
jgi:hypothetical protein